MSADKVEPVERDRGSYPGEKKLMRNNIKVQGRENGVQREVKVPLLDGMRRLEKEGECSTVYTVGSSRLVGSIHSLNYRVRSSPENRGARVRMFRAQGKMPHNHCEELKSNLSHGHVAVQY